jgi:uncharacterized protein with NRDE domain
MCLIAMAWGVSPDYPLVIASNRDEFYARPTAALAHWRTEAGHHITSGRDLQSGGTWMGFAQSGRFAMLTNVRNPQAAVPDPARSRGELVVAWLASTLDAATWSAQHDLAAYAGFNLIVGDWQAQQCHYISNQVQAVSGLFSDQNRPPAQQNIAQAATKTVANVVVHSVPSGQVIGLSNAALNTPWPKTTQLVSALEVVLKTRSSVAQLQARLQQSLQNDSPADDAQLPRTGVPLAQEKALSSIYVRYPSEAPIYGTRTSLCAVLTQEHRLHLTETTHAGPSQTALALAWPQVTLR